MNFNVSFESSITANGKAALRWQGLNSTNFK